MNAEEIYYNNKKKEEGRREERHALGHFPAFTCISPARIMSFWLYAVAGVVILYVLSSIFQKKKFDWQQQHVFFVTGCASGACASPCEREHAGWANTRNVVERTRGVRSLVFMLARPLERA